MATSGTGKSSQQRTPGNAGPSLPRASLVRVRLGDGVTRTIPPPISDGAFWYLRRGGEILLDENADYVRFDDEAKARAEAAKRPGAFAKWMPALRSN